MFRIILSVLSFSWCLGQLTFPQDNEELNKTIILFQWEQIPDAVTYNIQVFNQSYELIGDYLEENLIYIDKSCCDWGKSYSWKVRPVFENNYFGNFSYENSFSISDSIFIDISVDNFNLDDYQSNLILYNEWLPNSGTTIINQNGHQVAKLYYGVNFVNAYGEAFGHIFTNGIFQVGKLTFNNTIIWQSDIENIDIHEIKRNLNGDYIGLISVNQLGPIPIGEWTNNFQNLGFSADGNTNEFFWKAQKIVIWDQETKEEIWSWNPFDYFSMSDFDSYGGSWIEALINSNNGYISYDWTHINSFAFSNEYDAIYFSARNLNRITKIAYPSGEIVWNIGPDSSFGYGNDIICPEIGFSYQHNIQILDNDDLLLFDNGNLSWLFMGDQNPISRVRRFKVINNTNCELIWEYNLPPELYGSSTGSVQLLENGNYLIYTIGNGLSSSDCSILEVNDETELVNLISFNNQNSHFYRGFKIKSLYPEAFSVIFENLEYFTFEEQNLSGVLFDEHNPILKFSLFNKGGYNQLYSIEINDENNWFNAINDTVLVLADDFIELDYHPENLIDSTSYLNINIKPIYHSWYSQNFNFPIFNSLSYDKIIKAKKYILYQNYPNPFNPITAIRYDLPEATNVTISIYDMMGRKVKNLINTNQNSGYKSVIWNGTNDNGEMVSGGMYFYSIKTNTFSQTKKMILLK